MTGTAGRRWILPLDAFRTRLRDLGHGEERGVLVETRYAEGRYERLGQLAADPQAAKKATGTIPIVFAGVSDPLSVGLVSTLTRPGGNVTGVTLNTPELSAKRLSLLKEVAPTVSRVAVLANPEFKPSSSIVAETRLAARALGVELRGAAASPRSITSGNSSRRAA